jgi:adenine-specific DNA-methyltransferase
MHEDTLKNLRSTTAINPTDPVRQLAAGRLMAKGLAPSPASARVRYGRAFCYRLIAAYWQHLPAASGLALRPLLEPLQLTDLPEPAVTLAEGMGSAAASVDLIEAGYQLGLAYTALLPADYRARHGVFYTPPALTDRLLDQATAAGVDWTHCRVLDPACGGGAFLAPVARRMLTALGECEPAFAIQNITARLAGFEIDPFAAWMSQVTLDAVILTAYPTAKRLLPVVVRICDSLADDIAKPAFDLVIGNPPYGKLKLLKRQRNRYRRSLYGHANLYGLFTDLALRHTKPGGVIAYVTPTSFLAGEYFKRLRALLTAEAPPITLDLVSARKGVFDGGVLQETLLATYGRTLMARDAAVSVVHVNSPQRLATERTGVLRLPVMATEPWIVPRSARDAGLTDRLAHFVHRLEDWGYAVSTGPLVWNRHKDQLRSHEVSGAFPLIWAESVTPDGRFEFRSEKRNHKPYFMPRPDRDEWLITRKPCVLLQRTTAKEQHRRLIAAALPKSFLRTHRAVVIENHLNMLRPIVDKPAVPPEVLAAFLNSAAADQVFRCVSGSVAVSAFELESLPLPSTRQMARLGTLIAKRVAREEIERACANLYAVLPL